MLIKIEARTPYELVEQYFFTKFSAKREARNLIQIYGFSRVDVRWNPIFGDKIIITYIKKENNKKNELIQI